MHLVVDGDERVVWGEGPGGAFTMDQECLLPPVHDVLLHFGDIVRDVVDHVHVQVVRGGPENLRKCLGEENKSRISPSPFGSFPASALST